MKRKPELQLKESEKIKRPFGVASVGKTETKEIKKETKEEKKEKKTLTRREALKRAALPGLEEAKVLADLIAEYYSPDCESVTNQAAKCAETFYPIDDEGNEINCLSYCPEHCRDWLARALSIFPTKVLYYDLLFGKASAKIGSIIFRISSYITCFGINKYIIIEVKIFPNRKIFRVMTERTREIKSTHEIKEEKNEEEETIEMVEEPEIPEEENEEEETIEMVEEPEIPEEGVNLELLAEITIISKNSIVTPEGYIINVTEEDSKIADLLCHYWSSDIELQVILNKYDKREEKFGFESDYKNGVLFPEFTNYAWLGKPSSWNVAFFGDRITSKYKNESYPKAECESVIAWLLSRKANGKGVYRDTRMPLGEIKPKKTKEEELKEKKLLSRREILRQAALKGLGEEKVLANLISEYYSPDCELLTDQGNKCVESFYPIDDEGNEVNCLSYCSENIRPWLAKALSMMPTKAITNAKHFNDPTPENVQFTIASVSFIVSDFIKCPKKYERITIRVDIFPTHKIFRVNNSSEEFSSSDNTLAEIKIANKTPIITLREHIKTIIGDETDIADLLNYYWTDYADLMVLVKPDDNVYLRMYDEVRELKFPELPNNRWLGKPDSWIYDRSKDRFYSEYKRGFSWSRNPVCEPVVSWLMSRKESGKDTYRDVRMPYATSHSAI